MAVEALDTGALKKVESKILSGIPETWTKTTLGECFKWGSGGTPKSGTSEYYGGSIPWLVIGDLNDGIINKSGQTITEKGLENSSAKLVDKGTLLLAMYGSIGKLGIAGMQLATNQAIAFAEKNEIETKYIFSFLRYVRSQLSELGKGATQQNISQTVIKAFPFPLAPINEQKRIVAKIEELFSELDNGIVALKTAREQLKVYRQAVLKHAFEGKLTAKWREENANKLESPEQLLARIQQEREARHQQQLEEWKAAVKEWEANEKEGKKPGKPTLPKDSELNIDLAPLTLWELPLGWRWLKLCNLLQSSPQNGLYKPASDYGSGCQIIRIDNFYDGSVVNNETLKRLSVTDDEKETYGLQLDDLIVNRVNSIEYLGKSALIRRLNEPTVFESNIMRCSFVDNSVSNEYVTFYLNSKSGRKELCKNAKHAVNQASINQTDVGNAFVPICSIEEQQLIVLEVSAKLDSIDRTITDIELQLRQSETLRQSILKKAFSGQLVPQEPNDEPASELLARIQAEKAAEKAAQKASTKPKAAAKTGAKRGRKPKVAS